MSSADFVESKENEAPLRRRHKVETIEREEFGIDNHDKPGSLIDRFEQLVRPSEDADISETEDDPLEHWISYIKFYQEAFPSDTHQQFLLMERCIRALLKMRQYANDDRFIGVCAKYADKTQDPMTVFKYLYTKKIGGGNALLWIAWAYVAEKESDIQLAEKIFKKGISKNAQPIRVLKTYHHRFKLRMSRNWLNSLQQNDQLDDEENDIAPQRQTSRASRTRGGASMIPQFSVCVDGENGDDGYNLNHRQAEKGKEMTTGAEGWNQRGGLETKPKTQKQKQFRSRGPPPVFSIFVDEICADLNMSQEGSSMLWKAKLDASSQYDEGETAEHICKRPKTSNNRPPLVCPSMENIDKERWRMGSRHTHLIRSFRVRGVNRVEEALETFLNAFECANQTQITSSIRNGDITLHCGCMTRTMKIKRNHIDSSIFDFYMGLSDIADAEVHFIREAPIENQVDKGTGCSHHQRPGTLPPVSFGLHPDDVVVVTCSPSLSRGYWKLPDHGNRLPLPKDESSVIAAGESSFQCGICHTCFSARRRAKAVSDHCDHIMCIPCAQSVLCDEPLRIKDKSNSRHVLLRAGMCKICHNYGSWTHSVTQQDLPYDHQLFGFHINQEICPSSGLLKTVYEHAITNQELWVSLLNSAKSRQQCSPLLQQYLQNVPDL